MATQKTTKESPLQTVKRIYGSKEKLIDSVVSAAKEVGDGAADAKDRLASVSNQKLLRIAEVSRAVKDRYGNREKMVDAPCRRGRKSKRQRLPGKDSNLLNRQTV